MNTPTTTDSRPRLGLCLTGVFLLTFAVLVFQVVQTRILSVIAWYYMAFLAISVAMLGMTAGAVWVYLNRSRLTPNRLSLALADSSLLAAVSMPVSLAVQFCLITSLTPTVTSVFAWALLMAVMTVPYVFAGVAVSLVLTRSPFPIGLVYGVDLLGAAAGCAAVIGILNVFDGPSAILLAGFVSSLSALAFAHAATPPERAELSRRSRWQRPMTATVALALIIPVNLLLPIGLTPVMVKDVIESGWRTRTERWNSYSRIVASPPTELAPFLWGPSPLLDPNLTVMRARLNIDGAAGTTMFKFDGTSESIGFLAYDIVNLAYHLPGLAKTAVIGVGGGRDVMSAHLFGVKDITGVELNPIFIDFLTKDPFYASFANVRSIPGVKLHVDDARSWFAASSESFDLIQMSMIDTWAATGAGAFSLSENGLYTLEGWRAFVNRLTPDGVFTVSRWYSPGDVNETGRMIALALATMMDRGVPDPRQHVFVARASRIATLVLARSPITGPRLNRLHQETERLGFRVLLAPDVVPESNVLRSIVAARNIDELNEAGRTATLDLTVPTDNRPFFFNQLPFSRLPQVARQMINYKIGNGVVKGNLVASIALLLILLIALAAVVCTIVLPLRATARSASRPLIVLGTLYFSLIGFGFMFAEISLLQFFGVFLGHPIYAMGVCLFSLILSTGLGSLVSGRWRLDTRGRIAVWGVLLGAYLLIAQGGLTQVFAATTGEPLWTRIMISLAVVMPAGFLMGFAFPTGIRLVERIDSEPTPWFWGVNGATGVLASVLAVMVGLSFGINLTMFMSGLCYLALIPTAAALLAMPAPSLR